MIPVVKTDSDAASITKAAAIVRAGGVVAYPTETFYGLGADIRNERALEKLYAIKGRDFNKPISIIIGSRGDLTRFAREITPTAETIMDLFWPGGVTLLFEAARDLSERLMAGTGKIGIRLSSNPIATLLARNLSGAITATSANRSGGEECASAQEVIAALGETVDAVVDGGRTQGGAGSTIVDTTVDPPVVIREGIIPSSELHRGIRNVQGS